MKDVVLIKELGYLNIAVASTTFNQTIGAPLFAGPQWSTWTQVQDLFVCQEKIDIAGLTKMELTFYPLDGDVQKTAVSMGPTGAFAIEWIFVTRSPVDVTDFQAIAAPNMPFALPGQLSIDDSFENIIWGKAWTWVKNTSLQENIGVSVNTTLFGSGEPTNGDTLYVYRLVRLINATAAGSAEFGNCRLILSGQVREEPEFQQLMRMRRTYELQQGRDED